MSGDSRQVFKELPRRFLRALLSLLSRIYQFLARDRFARVFDATTVLWVVIFHRVLVAKFAWGPFGFDEHYFLHEGWSVTKGLVPYRDLQEFKPPAIFFVNALGIKLFGLENMAFRHIFSILSLCGFVSLTVALLSRRTNRVFVAALMTLMIDHFFDGNFHDSSINNAETLGVAFFMIGCGILLVRTKWERVQQVMGAAFLALAPLSKEPLVFATLLAWLTILLLHRIDSPRTDAAKQFALFTIAGAAAVAATWLVYMLATHSLGSYIAQLKLSVAYTKTYAQQLNWFPKEHQERLAEYWKRLRAAYVNAAHIGAFIPLFVAPLFLGARRNRIVGVAALLTAGAALYGVTIGSGFAAHYFIMAMTGTFFYAIIGGLALDAYSKRAGVGLRRWVGATWLAIALVSTYPRFSEEWAKYATYKPLPPPVNSSEIDFVRAYSNPGDRIWTLGDPLLYVYSDRLTAFREGIVIDELIEYHPGDSDEQRLAGQREAVLKNRPKLIVFGDDKVNYSRKQRYINALVMPIVRDGGYVKLNDKFYVRR